MDAAIWLPAAFAGLLGLSILIYVILDGYDLGVGILASQVSKPEKDRMIASIGPFWDANETWLVLAGGILLVAFPFAHGVILTELYLPVAIMLIGLILRGVAFDFRVKAHDPHRDWWDRAFVLGSLMAALSQGYMLGLFIMGFAPGFATHVFGVLTAICLAAAYIFIGACWLIMKSEGALQQKAVDWAQRSLSMAALGMLAVSIVTPLMSQRIFDRWFSLPDLLLLAPIPVMAALLFLALSLFLRRMPRTDHSLDWVPFAGAIGVFALGFHGLAYSFWPYVVPEQMTVWEAASAPESLMIIFVGTCFVLPVVLAYSTLAYIVFRGKAEELRYD